MSLSPPFYRVEPKDGPSIDAFGRLRVGNPFPVWDNKNIHSKHTNLWSEETNGTATVAHDADQSAVLLTVGTASGEYAIRQTRRYFAYVPGKSQRPVLTYVMAPAQTGLVQRVGYFDGPATETTVGEYGNGIFFELYENTLNLVIRSDTSGNIVDTKYPRSGWLDQLDGSGPSGLTLDPTKFQISDLDFQWLGGGRVRFNYSINGQSIQIKTVNHANVIDTVYMRTPTLPIRYEIRNIGITTGATLKEICSSVSSEGGYTLPGVEFSALTDPTALVAVTTRAPVLAIRLKNTLGGKPNRSLARFLEVDAYAETKNTLFEIVHVHTPTAITASWQSVGPESAVEYAISPTFTPASEHVISSFAVSAGQGGKGGADQVTSEFINEHSFITQNFDSSSSDMFVVYATSFSTAAAVWAGLSWIEFE